MVDTSTQTARENSRAADDRAEELLAGAHQGDTSSVNELIRLLYPEIKAQARSLMANERQGHTFGSGGTELVNRLILRILERRDRVFEAAQDRRALIGLFTRRMKQILVDYAKYRGAQKSPSPDKRVDLVNAEGEQIWEPASTVDAEQVMLINEILTKLDSIDREAAEALELRFFAGLENEEAAATMGLSVATFRRVLKRATVFFKSMAGSQA